MHFFPMKYSTKNWILQIIGTTFDDTVFSQRKLDSPRAEGQAIISKHNSSLYNIVVCLFLRFSETMPRYICLKNQHQELFFPT